MRKRRTRRKAVGTRAPILVAAKPNARWSLDFVHDQLACGRRFHPLEFLYFTFVTKPQMLLNALVGSFGRILANDSNYVLLSSFLLLVAVRLVRPSVRDKDDLNLGSMVIGGMAIAAS